MAGRGAAIALLWTEADGEQNPEKRPRSEGRKSEQDVRPRSPRQLHTALPSRDIARLQETREQSGKQNTKTYVIWHVPGAGFWFSFS